ncbi:MULTISPECIES: hypothetical protein [unclassified Nostoc]|uniref:hypothetical protein n=1 Tax=unclassified Nostoc TaxID=2593658 RepID=UPI002AD3BED1|nr:hypothetical protein [Nostoc sp. DedQUE03]MDZ7975835.1 hypothetical protein [Nostoc sp. DedQUE03]MDZ8048369.1 hypothetical protein [Nostoc sp. DedQUE02]
MKTNSRITNLIIFCIAVYILLPKVAACTGVFNTASANAYTATSGDTLIARKINSENLKDVYIPPNYGGPDSHNGSGTR